MKINRKINKQDLNDVFHIANNYYRDLQKGELDDQQFRSRCFMEAVCTVLHIEGLTYPERKNCEPLDDFTLEAEEPKKESQKP